MTFSSWRNKKELIILQRKSPTKIFGSNNFITQSYFRTEASHTVSKAYVWNKQKKAPLGPYTVYALEGIFLFSLDCWFFLFVCFVLLFGCFLSLSFLCFSVPSKFNVTKWVKKWWNIHQMMKLCSMCDQKTALKCS